MKNRKSIKNISAAVALLGCAVSASVFAQGSIFDGTNYSSSYNPSWYVLGSIDRITPDSRFGSDHRGVGHSVWAGHCASAF